MTSRKRKAGDDAPQKDVGKPASLPAIPSEDPRLDRDIEGLLMASNDIRMINMQILDEFLRSRKLSERGLDIITLIGVGLDRPSKLNKYFGIFPSAITLETDKLVDAGYITRRQDKRDRRVTLLSLTSRGRAVRKDALELVNRAFRERLADVSRQELDAAVNVLRKIVGDLHEPTRPDY